MSQILVKDLSKTFSVAQRQPGLVGAIRGLFSRVYSEVHALNNVSFTIDPGELVGYIGPNGAGKSTTIKILAGILVPTSGECLINGRTPWRQRRDHVADIGVVFGQRSQLWWDLPVIESFELLRDIYRVPPQVYRESSAELIHMMDIESVLDTPVRMLSLGQRMRCDLVASLLHRPSILFLDEPTIGLDAVSKLAVREFVRQLNQQHGVTVILTTHDMDDIEALCRRIVVIGAGTILNDGDLAGLRRKINPERRLKVEFADNPVSISMLDSGQVLTEKTVRVVGHEGNTLHLAFDPGKITTTDLIHHISSRFAVKDLFVENPPIEELIAQLYGDTRVDKVSDV